MRYGRGLHYLKITYGWSLLLIVAFTVLLFRYLDAKAENRLDDGIDPAWLTDERERDAVIAGAAEPGAAGQRHPS
jgi:arabinofuranan 3-O-arabinosyltransferase